MNRYEAIEEAREALGPRRDAITIKPALERLWDRANEDKAVIAISAIRDERDELREENALLTSQLGRSGDTAKREIRRAQEAERERDAMRSVLRRVDGKFRLTTRWPCPDCGRVGPGEPLRTITFITEDEEKSIQGCHYCNADALMEDVQKVLRGERVE